MSDRIVPGVHLPTSGIDAASAFPSAGTSLPVADIPVDSDPPPMASLYSIAKVDDSGRVADLVLASALSWKPGEPLDITVVGEAVVIRSAPDGLYCHTRKAYLTLPSRMRQRCQIQPGDTVVLTAIPDRKLMIVTSVRLVHDALTDHFQAILDRWSVGHG
ncbi:bifunctional DNA-binding transcriptional regulator/antitoxin component of YhaV-PrlF toxin-antitoxin module [Kutzneria viridogrisea]|nr:hypothetical protein [Kutzneria albida]MBA8924801.1 bifunctional DNA-binding transcriptional regulator/antitoxin component of YhaV-PrlF toxin-antitoxin module [Kutzneria viridogrisea]